MKWTRRLLRVLAATIALTANSGCASSPMHSTPLSSTESTVLKNGLPFEAGLDAARLSTVDRLMAEGIRQGDFPGAVVLIARHGIIAKEEAYGDAVEYTDADFHRLENPLPMKPDTLFDLASVSKLFTTIAVMKLYDEGKVNLDKPVVKYIPAFDGKDKTNITVRMLLTHTSGLQPDIPLLQAGKTEQARIAAVLQVKPHHTPGTQYEYSDLNFIVLGLLVQDITGESLSKFIHDNISIPLGLHDTMYNPPSSLRNRIAATEFQTSPNRGMVWGQVEDENAYALGGVAGHAGVFSTAHDLAVMAQMLLNGGVYAGQRILSRVAVSEMERNQNLALHTHALGFEINQPWYMGNLSSPSTLGHTGFSGTSIVIDPSNDLICILLTNRVHPTRLGPSINSSRAALANAVSDAILAYDPPAK